MAGVKRVATVGPPGLYWILARNALAERYMDLVELLAKGNVWMNLGGSDSSTALAHAVAVLEKSARIPDTVRAADLLESLLAREQRSSTALGGGLAFPHPTASMAPDPSDAFIALFYPRFALSWASPDGEPVKAIFMVVSNNPKDHLIALSRLAKACANSGFRELLDREAGQAELCAYLGAFFPKPST